MSPDRAAILAELNDLFSKIGGTPEERRAIDIRIAELNRRLNGVSETSVRFDCILGSRPELPPEDSSGELWREDPYLRFAKEKGEDIR